MDKKLLAILLILLTGATFMTIGCAGRRNADGAAPTVSPSMIATPGPARQAPPAPATGGVPAGTALPTIAPGATASNAGGLDPSLADISDEGLDPGSSSDMETGLPTPTIDQ